MAKHINKEKAQEYTKEYLTNGFNKTKAYEAISGKDNEHSNSYASAFHDNLVKLGFLSENSLKEDLMTEERHKRVLQAIDKLINSSQDASRDKGVRLYIDITGSKSPDKTQDVPYEKPEDQDLGRMRDNLNYLERNN